MTTTTQRPSAATLFKAPTEAEAPNPAAVSRQLARKNRVIDDRFASRVFRPTEVPATFRVLPALPESDLTGPTNWLFRFESYDFENCGELLRPGADSEKNGTYAIDPSRQDDPITKFRRYIYNETDLGRKKGHTDADMKLKLFPRVKGLCWIRHTQRESVPQMPLPALYLLYGSANSGERGAEGFMAKIGGLQKALDEDSQSPNFGKPIYGNPADIERGYNITLKKTGRNLETKYSIQPSVTRSPLDGLLTDILVEFPNFATDILAPLEKVVHVPTDAELINHVINYASSLGHGVVARAWFETNYSASVGHGGASPGSAALVAREQAASKAANARTVQAEADEKALHPAPAAVVTPPAPKPAPAAPAAVVQTPAPAPVVTAPPAPAAVAPAAPAAVVPAVVATGAPTEKDAALARVRKFVDFVAKAKPKNPVQPPEVEAAFQFLLGVYESLTADEKAPIEALLAI